MKILDVYNRHEQNRKSSVMSDIEDDIKEDTDKFAYGRKIFLKLASYDDIEMAYYYLDILNRHEIILLEYFITKVSSDKKWVIKHLLQDYKCV